MPLSTLRLPICHLLNRQRSPYPCTATQLGAGVRGRTAGRRSGTRLWSIPVSTAVCYVGLIAPVQFAAARVRSLRAFLFPSAPHNVVSMYQCAIQLCSQHCGNSTTLRVASAAAAAGWTHPEPLRPNAHPAAVLAQLMWRLLEPPPPSHHVSAEIGIATKDTHLQLGCSSNRGTSLAAAVQQSRTCRAHTRLTHSHTRVCCAPMRTRVGR